MRDADDELALGEALIRELFETGDPVAQREAVDGIRECEKRLRQARRFEDGLQLLDNLLAWQLASDSGGHPQSPDEEIAHTMLSRAGRLLSLKRFGEAALQSDELVRGYAGDLNHASFALRAYAANALYWKGQSYLALEQWPEAISAFNELISSADAVPDDALYYVASAFTGRARALEDSGDDDGVVDACAEGIAALADAADSKVIALREEMMSQRALALVRLDRSDEAAAAFDALIALPAPINLRYVASAYETKALLLLVGREFEAAIATAEEGARRFASSDDSMIRRCAAKCLDAKIDALKALRRDEAAHHTAEQLVNLFGPDLDPQIEAVVAAHAHRLGRGRSRLRFRGVG